MAFGKVANFAVALSSRSLEGGSMIEKCSGSIGLHIYRGESVIEWLGIAKIELWLFLHGKSGLGFQNSEPFLPIAVSKSLKNVYSSCRNCYGESEGTQASLGDFVDLSESRIESKKGLLVSFPSTRGSITL